ncbi:hypothetical protein TRAPUB_7828 [Trametes pubescens]|uniref:Uncharacterized protein n=1 Tax=Trametes pubescens TaxID=154538 RepID=A0A1M2V2E8_TRAPU|nr:hypothetical protein TRAPUB_7828 [Trametes pubescens]
MIRSYWYLVTNYFDPTRLFSGICFFARRVYIIGSLKYRILVMVTGVMFIAELGFATAGTYYASVLPNFAEFHKVAWLNSASFSLAIAADLILTVVLIMVLRKSRTGFDHTDSLIDVLIMYSVCTVYVNSVLAALNYRDTVRNPTTSLRQGKAINLSTSVRTGTRGDVSMDWATTNHIRSTEFENSVIELKSTREMSMMDNIDEV